MADRLIPDRHRSCTCLYYLSRSRFRSQSCARSLSRARARSLALALASIDLALRPPLPLSSSHDWGPVPSTKKPHRSLTPKLSPKPQPLVMSTTNPSASIRRPNSPQNYGNNLCSFLFWYLFFWAVNCIRKKPRSRTTKTSSCTSAASMASLLVCALPKLHSFNACLDPER